LLGNDNTTRGTLDDIRNHTQITRPPLPAAEHLLPRTDGGYTCHEVAAVTPGEFTGRVWRHIHHDSDGTRFKFDATIDSLVDASSSGVGDNPQRLRELARRRLGHRRRARRGSRQAAASGREWADCLTDSRQWNPRPEVLGGGSVMSLSPALAGGVFPHPLNRAL